MTMNLDQCNECGKGFKRMEINDPRKGYDVLNEGAKPWRIQCKGCGQKITVPKQDGMLVSD